MASLLIQRVLLLVILVVDQRHVMCMRVAMAGDLLKLRLPKVLDSFVIQRDPRAETAVTVVLEGKKNHVFAFSSLLASGLAVIALTYSA